MSGMPARRRRTPVHGPATGIPKHGSTSATTTTWHRPSRSPPSCWRSRAADPGAKDWSTLGEHVTALTSERVVRPIRERAPCWAEAGQTFFLASGAARPLARFAAYKMFEFNRFAQFSGIEEYCHTHYFVTRPGDRVVLPRGAGRLSRLLGWIVAAQWITYLQGRIGAPDIDTFHAGFDTERLIAASMRTGEPADAHCIAHSGRDARWQSVQQ